jgi:hypothetical protein
MTERIFDPQWGQTSLRPSRVLLRKVFHPYLQALQKTRKQIGILPTEFGSLRYGGEAKKVIPMGFWKRLRRILRGEYLRI